jgi:virginiamycin B lyase
MGGNLRLVVDLERETTPIGGQISTATGPTRAFHGWLELASAIETHRNAAVTAPESRHAYGPARQQRRPARADVARAARASAVAVWGCLRRRVRARALRLALRVGVVGLVLPVSAAGAATITEYPVPTAAGMPWGITAGPDGALWFTELDGNKIGRLTTSGTFTEYSVPTPASRPYGITAAPDGALWFTEAGGDNIGRITTSGSFTEYAVPPGSAPRGVTVGPDGALWFAEAGSNKIGRITTSGSFTEYAIPTPASDPLGITAGPDGALWFTEEGGDNIGRVTISGSFTEYPIPTPASLPDGITAGPDGALWFTELSGNSIGRVTTAGSFTEFSDIQVPIQITAGLDGGLWFTAPNNIGRITTTGSSTEYALPTPGGVPIGITVGPDGALWFTEPTGNQIGRLTPVDPTSTAVSCSPSSVVVGQSALCTATVTDNGNSGPTTPTGTISFASSDPGSFGGSPCTLSETSRGVASCQVSYTPTAIGSGSHTISAHYGADSTHLPSDGSTAVTVTARSTSTGASCSPGTVAVGVPTVCTVTVTDTDVGASSPPSGSVGFISSDPGAFGGGGSCTLSSTGGSTAACHVSYTPGATGVPTRAETVTSTYGGDTTHAGSAGTTTVTVQPTDRQFCKTGGYRNYGFPDQGTCITWVNSQAHPGP